MNQGFGLNYNPNFYTVRDSGHVPPGMDCLQLQLQPHQLRTQPFHYLINEQAKSLLALQELQNEVGALLEFRDLVMETFPNLRQKMSSSSSHNFSNNQNYCSNLPMPLSGSLNSRHWEPGIKVKRKIINKSENESSFGRVRSNSHSSKIQSTQPKSSEAISGVQDSGFSTETNSSNKDHASSTATSVPLPVQFDDPFSRRKETGPHKDSRRSEYDRSDEESSEDGLVLKVNEAEEELWNLLDVIHTKGTKLREEVETLQLRLVVEEIENHLREKELEIKKVGRRFNRRCRSLDNIGDSGSCVSLTLTETDGFQPHFKCHDLSFERDDVFTKKRTRSIELEDVDHIREERNMLLDKLAEMETENVANRIKTSELQNEISALISTKEELQEQLLQAVKQKNELNSRIHELHLKFVTGDRKVAKGGSRTDKASSKDLTDSESSQSEVSSLNRLKSSGDDIDAGKISEGGGRSSNEEKIDSIDLEKFRRSNSSRKLGALDGILSNPKRFKKYCKLTEHSRKKLEAILKEKNYLELQRHLLIFVVENQTLNHELESSIKSRENLCEQLDKFRKENDELLFRLEEKSIELEGTRAQVRVLEKLQHQSKNSFESKPHPSETSSKSGENFTFLENDHLRSKGFSESEINRARQIFLESQNRKVDKSEIMKLLNRSRHSSQTSSSTEVGTGFDLGKTSNVIPILALPLPAMSSHQSSETESTQALEISSELEADMARMDNKNESLKNEKSPYRRRPSKIPLNIQKNAKSLAPKSLKTGLNASSPSLKKSDGELSKSKDFNTSLKKCSLDNLQNSIGCRSPSSQNPNSIKYSSVGRTSSQLSIASQRSHTPSRMDKRKSLTNSGKEENSLTASTRNLSLKQTTNFSNIRQRDTLTRKNQNDSTDNSGGGGGGGGGNGSGVGSGGGGKRTFRSSFRESFRNRISIDGNSMSSRKEVSMSSSARKDSIQSKSNRSNPVQAKTNTNKSILTSDSDTTKFEGSPDHVAPTQNAHIPHEDALPSRNIVQVSPVAENHQNQPRQQQQQQHSLVKQDSEIFLDSLNSSAKPLKAGEEKSNLLKEVRQNFHKKLTEKVSATLSGHRLPGTGGQAQNVWNCPKSEDDYVSEEVEMAAGGLVVVGGVTPFEMNYFDSIDNSKDDSLLINSCYYLNNNVENEAMAELDSLEIKLSHVAD